MQRYLAPNAYVDFEDSAVIALAKSLSRRAASELDLVRSCFEFVRDEIRHSADFRLNPVTRKASEVLRHKTGYCYAKSHLLAALLRANEIPAGLCYQRLLVGDGDGPCCLHGLNAVYCRHSAGCVSMRGATSRELMPSSVRRRRSWRSRFSMRGNATCRRSGRSHCRWSSASSSAVRHMPKFWTTCQTSNSRSEPSRSRFALLRRCSQAGRLTEADFHWHQSAPISARPPLVG